MKILDGKATAAEIRSEMKTKVAELRERNVPVRLDVILASDDPASATYVAMKERDCAEVGIESLARVVESHSWANIPEEEKGQGKFYRRGSSGGWREDLTPEEVKAIETMTGEVMDRLGYERSTSSTSSTSSTP